MLRKMLIGLLVGVFIWCGSSFAVDIVIDGDDSDWASVSTLIQDPDDQEGQYPEDQAVLWTDVVDVKEVKFLIKGTDAYYMIRFWGAPAWPNGGHETGGRGYYHLFLDLDNDVNTGWDTGWYEGHITNLGEAQRNLGAEMYLQLTERTDRENLWERANYYAEDVAGYDPIEDTGDTFDMYEFPGPDGEFITYDDELMFASCVDPNTGGEFAHAWGTDFVEVKQSLLPSIIYWQDKGMDYFKPGDTIGIASFVETPVDDWGNDFSDGADYVLPALAAEGSSWGAIKSMFK
jgi:hypothetical protein